jgi:hypothetical protein
LQVAAAEVMHQTFPSQEILVLLVVAAVMLNLVDLVLIHQHQHLL